MGKQQTLNATLLIVDDEEHIVNVTRFYMKDRVTNILTAKNGKEVPNFLHREPPDFLDWGPQNFHREPANFHRGPPLK